MVLFESMALLKHKIGVGALWWFDEAYFIAFYAEWVIEAGGL